MSKASPTTYRAGSIGEFAAWTKDVVRDPATVQGAPKKWLDETGITEAVARQAHEPAVPPEANAKWKAALQERIDAATRPLALLPAGARQRQRPH